MRTTLKAVNHALAGLGTDARLVKSDGYFYFKSGEAEGWLDKTVSGPTLSSRTVDEWLMEYKRLRDLNRNLLQGRPSAAQSSASKRAHPRRSKKS